MSLPALSFACVCGAVSAARSGQCFSLHWAYPLGSFPHMLGYHFVSPGPKNPELLELPLLIVYLSNCLSWPWAYPEPGPLLSFLSFSLYLLNLPWACGALSPGWVSHFISWPRPYPELLELPLLLEYLTVSPGPELLLWALTFPIFFLNILLSLLNLLWVCGATSPAWVSKCLEMSWAYSELWKTLSLFSFSHSLLAQSLPWVCGAPSWTYPDFVELPLELTLSLWSSLLNIPWVCGLPLELTLSL